MCITFFYIPEINTANRFVSAFNRDESVTKLTCTLGPFEDDTNIIAGRDLEGKGKHQIFIITFKSQ